LITSSEKSQFCLKDLEAIFDGRKCHIFDLRKGYSLTPEEKYKFKA